MIKVFRGFSLFLLLIVFSGFSLSGSDHQEKKLRATTHFHRSFRRFFSFVKTMSLALCGRNTRLYSIVSISNFIILK